VDVGRSATTRGVVTTRHGENVERFYSHGAEARAREANGFLSFGYWKDETRDYDEATENLLDLVLEQAEIDRPDLILNVACGNGIETERILERLQPRRIHGLDITRAHIDTCKKRAAARGLEDRMVFEHGDACQMPFAAEAFSHLVCVEGITHFDTRERFFAEAHRVLQPGGMLMLSDSILHRLPPGIGDEIASRVTSRLWHVPRANWIDIAGYRRQLEANGFRVEFVRSIGDRVFPGFASFNVRREAIANSIRVRGLPVGLGLAFICWLLGDLHRRGILDYVLVKAWKR